MASHVCRASEWGHGARWVDATFESSLTYTTVASRAAIFRSVVTGRVPSVASGWWLPASSTDRGGAVGTVDLKPVTLLPNHRVGLSGGKDLYYVEGFLDTICRSRGG